MRSRGLAKVPDEPGEQEEERREDKQALQPALDALIFSTLVLADGFFVMSNLGEEVEVHSIRYSQRGVASGPRCEASVITGRMR